MKIEAPQGKSTSKEASVPVAVRYPESDGKPIGETDPHITVILYLRWALRHLLRREETTYVAANMLFYYEEGDPSAVRSPDVFAVKGVAKHDRRTYKLWAEKAAPCTIFEITSRSSRLEDQGTKRALYEMLGVAEYFLFDPLDEYLMPRLQGFRLEGGTYAPMTLQADGALRSEELGAILRPEGILLRVVDVATGKPVPTAEELSESLEAQVERAEAGARHAEAEAQRAEAEAQRAEAEARRAEAEARRATRAEAELARLRSEVEGLRRRERQGE